MSVMWFCIGCGGKMPECGCSMEFISDTCIRAICVHGAKNVQRFDYQADEHRPFFGRGDA